MLTDKDITNLTVKLSAVLATKEDIRELKSEVADLRESLRSLTTSVDNLAKAVNNLTVEYKAVMSRVDRHEKWIQQIAHKLGLNLES